MFLAPQNAKLAYGNKIPSGHPLARMTGGFYILSLRSTTRYFSENLFQKSSHIRSGLNGREFFPRRTCLIADTPPVPKFIPPAHLACESCMNTVENENHRKVGAIFLSRPPVHLFTHNVHNRKRKHWYYVQRRRYVKARSQSASAGDVGRNFLFSAAATTPLLHRRKAFPNLFIKEVNKTVVFFIVRESFLKKLIQAAPSRSSGTL